MPRLRYPLLSLLAVALAFAAGIVWGIGPLTQHLTSSVQTETRQLDREQQQLRAQLAELEGKVHIGEKLAEEVSAPLVADQLDGHSVAIFLLPGADPKQAARIKKTLKAAGASVTNTLTISSSYVDPANARTPLEDVALRLVPPGVSFPSGASPIERVSTVLARSTVTARAEEAGKVDDDGAEVLAGLQELGAVRVEGDPGARSTLAVLVAGAPEGAAQEAAASADAAHARNEALRGLARALDVGSRGAAVVGPEAATDALGLLRHLRVRDAATGGFSTIDGADEAIGPLSTVLALAEQLRGESGHYGSSPRADRLLPKLVPAQR